MSLPPTPNKLTQLPPSDAHPRYTTPELQSYFTLINLPKTHLWPILQDPSLATTKAHGLHLLQALTTHHVCAIPFENLILHYSPHKTVSLSPADLYTRFVTRHLGGRCMENNTFFGTVLRSLGFEVRNCAGRVSRSMSPYPEIRKTQGHTYDGWNHMLNLVRLDQVWYVVDVGMGSMGPNMPYPLEDGIESTSVAPRLIRVQLRSIFESYAYASADPPKLWCYDVCYDPTREEKEWTPVYCFTETEFLPQDYEVMSWYTSTNPTSFFTRYPTCTKMLLDDNGETIVGNVTLFKGTVKESIGGSSRVSRECGTEEERLQALKEVFDVHLTAEEEGGIPDERRLA